MRRLRGQHLLAQNRRGIVTDLDRTPALICELERLHRGDLAVRHDDLDLDWTEWGFDGRSDESFRDSC